MVQNTWCNTCMEDRSTSESETICTICGDTLQTRQPSTSPISTSTSTSLGRREQSSENMFESVMNSIRNTDPNDLEMNQRNLEAAIGMMLASGASDILQNIPNLGGVGGAPPAIPNDLPFTNSKATSQKFLKQIPRIIIDEHSCMLNRAIVECVIPSSSSSSSSSDNTILQLDALTAEFGPAPPYNISGDLLSFLDCEADIRRSDASTQKMNAETVNSSSSSSSSQIAYMMRGKGLTFVQRAMHAQTKGAKALVIANHVAIWPYIMKDSKNTLSQYKAPLSIPVVMIQNSSHSKLISALQQKLAITCRIHATKNDDENEDSNACIICREQFQIGDTVMRLPFCFHSFHEACAMMWLEKHNTSKSEVD